MGAGSEILTQEKDHDLEVVEIPITARYDIENRSSKNPVAHGVGVLNSSLGYCCYNNIIRPGKVLLACICDVGIDFYDPWFGAIGL